MRHDFSSYLSKPFRHCDSTPIDPIPSQDRPGVPLPLLPSLILSQSRQGRAIVLKFKSDHTLSCVPPARVKMTPDAVVLDNEFTLFHSGGQKSKIGSTGPTLWGQEGSGGESLLAFPDLESCVP